MSALDTQIGGGHYKGMKIQPMEYSMANGLDACQHTAIKYISRFRDKGGIQDLEKAKHCIDMLIEFERRALEEEAVDTRRHDEEAYENLVSESAARAESYLAKPETDPYGPPDAEGWYTWNGDETMRPAGRVECKMRGGNSAFFDAETACWDHRQVPGDIVKWRPAQ